MASDGLQVLVASTAAWPGRNEILVDLLAPDGSRLAPYATDVRFSATAPDGGAPTTLESEVVQLAPEARALYRLTMDADHPGPWRIGARLTDPSGEPGRGLEGEGLLWVSDDRGTPALGSLVPSVETPTLRSAAGQVAAITSDPEPDPDFYERSVAEAVAAGEPFVYVVDSFTFRTTETCGAGLGHSLHLRTEFPDVRMIHAEPLETAYVDGELRLDPAEGPPRLAPWAASWGIDEPPWVFVVDGEGRLRAKFAGISGSDELRLALSSIAS